MKTTLFIPLLTAGLVFLLGISPRPGNSQFTLLKHVISNGGGTAYANNYNAASTLGQHMIGRATSPLNTAQIGFWFTGELAIGIEEPESTPVSSFFIYPNPANLVTTVTFINDHNIHVIIKLISIVGNVELSITDEDLGPGNHQFPVAVEKIPPGMYICSLQSDDVLQAKLVSVVR